MDGVPFSCCSTLSPLPCVQQNLSKLRNQQQNLWRRGCRVVLLDHYTGIMRSIGLTVLLIWLFELLVLTGVRYLQTAMENLVRLGDPESESEGWILENSLAETARSNFNIIKNLGKCYQVEDDPNLNITTETTQREQQETGL